MMDQANKLRSLIKEKKEQGLVNAQKLSARVITVTSGKGGVGKTNFTINLAIQLCKQNKRVAIIDADFGLANIEVLFGIIPKYNLAHVFNGERIIEEIITDGPMGIKFLSGGSGLRELANITERQMSFVIEKLTYLDSIADVILIDTGAGISNSVVNFIKASNETIVITTPEPTSITDAYAIIKTAKDENSHAPSFKLVVNRADDADEAMDIYDKISKVTEKFLGVQLINLGYIPFDNNLIKAVKRQEPVSVCFPNSDCVKSIEKISLRLLDLPIASTQTGTGFKGFIKRLIGGF